MRRLICFQYFVIVIVFIFQVVICHSQNLDKVNTFIESTNAERDYEGLTLDELLVIFQNHTAIHQIEGIYRYSKEGYDLNTQKLLSKRNGAFAFISHGDKVKWLDISEEGIITERDIELIPIGNHIYKFHLNPSIKPIKLESSITGSFQTKSNIITGEQKAVSNVAGNEISFGFNYEGEKLVFAKDYAFSENISIRELSQGTGVFINNTYILTNAHVVTPNINSFVLPSICFANNESHSEDYYSCEIVDLNNEFDLALLRIKPISFIKTLNLGNEVYFGEKLFVLGYPLEYILGNSIKLMEGRCSTVSNHDNKTFQLSASLNPGNSGGPVFNTKGEIVGLVSSKLKNAEGISFAIRPDIILKYLKDNNVVLSNSISSEFVENIDDYLDNVVIVKIFGD